MNENDLMSGFYRALSDAEKVEVKRIKADAAELHAYLDTLGASYDLSVAKTKIEEAVMWTTKFLTR